MFSSKNFSIVKDHWNHRWSSGSNFCWQKKFLNIAFVCTFSKNCNLLTVMLLQYFLNLKFISRLGGNVRVNKQRNNVQKYLIQKIFLGGSIKLILRLSEENKKKWKTLLLKFKFQYDDYPIDWITMTYQKLNSHVLYTTQISLFIFHLHLINFKSIIPPKNYQRHRHRWWWLVDKLITTLKK